jgi:hypothetical protein
MRKKGGRMLSSDVHVLSRTLRVISRLKIHGS